MPSLMVLSCPVCGAPLGTDSSRCGYCGSVVVIQTDLPRLEPHLLNKAVIHDHIGKYRSAVRQDNNDETAHYGLGLAYFNLGLLEEAGEELAQAARLMPENPHIQIQLAVVYAELAKSGRTGFEDLAWDRLKRANLLVPAMAEVSLLDAELHLRRGEWQDSVAAWRKASDEDPDSIRKPIATFLSNHKRIFADAPQFQAGHSTPKSKPAFPNLHILFAVIAFLGFCVLTGIFANISESQETAGGGSTGFINFLIFVTVILSIAAPLWIYFKFRPSSSPQDRFGSDSPVLLSDEQQQFLSGTITPASRMLGAATYVADELVLEEEEERAEAELQKQQAINSTRSRQNWLTAAQSANAMLSPPAHGKSGCSGCGLCLLAFAFVGCAFLVTTAGAIL